MTNPSRFFKSRWFAALVPALAVVAGWEIWNWANSPRLSELALPGNPSPAHSQRLARRCGRLYQEFCQRRPDFGTRTFTDPTGEVWLDSDAEALIRSAASEDPDWIATVFSEERRKRILEIERWVKLELLSWIAQQPASVFLERDRQELVRRLRSTRVEFPDYRTGYPDEPTLLGESQVFYERLQGPSAATSTRRLRFGGAYVLGTTSRYNLVFTLAHELAHAIDPCELRSTGWSIPAFDRLASCLISEGLAAAPADRVECRRNDQLSETFADWVAVEISARAVRRWGSEYPEPQRWATVGNTVRDLCEEDEAPLAQDTHPSPRIRIEKILGLNPDLRTYLGCSAPSSTTCELR